MPRSTDVKREFRFLSNRFPELARAVQNAIDGSDPSYVDVDTLRQELDEIERSTTCLDEIRKLWEK